MANKLANKKVKKGVTDKKAEVADQTTPAKKKKRKASVPAIKK